MLLIRLLSIIYIAILSISHVTADEVHVKRAFEALKKKDWAKARLASKKANDPVLEKIILSNQYLDVAHKQNNFKELLN